MKKQIEITYDQAFDIGNLIDARYAAAELKEEFGPLDKALKSFGRFVIGPVLKKYYRALERIQNKSYVTDGKNHFVKTEKGHYTSNLEKANEFSDAKEALLDTVVNVNVTDADPEVLEWLVEEFEIKAVNAKKEADPATEADPASTDAKGGKKQLKKA